MNPAGFTTIHHPLHGVLYCKTGTLCVPNAEGGVTCQNVQVCTKIASSIPKGDVLVRVISNMSS